MITERSKREPFKLHFPHHYITNDLRTILSHFTLYLLNDYIKDTQMNNVWTVPQATEMRFGFEITMYVNNR